MHHYIFMHLSQKLGSRRSMIEAYCAKSPYAISKLITCGCDELTDHSKEVNEYLCANAVILFGSFCSCDIEKLAPKLTRISLTQDFKSKDYELQFCDYELFTKVNYPCRDISQLRMTLSKESNEIIIHVRGDYGYRKNVHSVKNARGGKNGWKMTYTGFIHENLTNSRKWKMYERMIIKDPCMIINKIMHPAFTRVQYDGSIEKLLNNNEGQSDIDVLGLVQDSSKHMITAQKNNLLLIFHCDKVRANHSHLQAMQPFTLSDDTKEKKMTKNPELCLTHETLATVGQRIKESYEKLSGGVLQQRKRKSADPEYKSDEWVLDDSYPVVAEPKTNQKLMVKIMFYEMEKIQKLFWSTSSGMFPLSHFNGKTVSCIDSDSKNKYNPEQICHCSIRHVDHLALGVHKESCFLCQRSYWNEHRENNNAQIFFQYMSTHLMRPNPHKTLFDSIDWNSNEDGVEINDNVVAFGSWDNTQVIYFDFLEQSILSEAEMQSHKWLAGHNKLRYQIPKRINLETLSNDITDETFYDEVVQFCPTLPNMYSQTSQITKMILLMFAIGLAKLPHQIFFMLIGKANMGKSEIKRILQECISDSRKVKHMDNGIHAGNFGVSMIAGDKDTSIVTFDEIPSKSFNHTQLLQSVDRVKINFNKKGVPEAQEGQVPFMIWACNEFFPWPIKDSVLRRCGVINTDDFVRKNIYPSPVEAILSNDHEAHGLVYNF